MGVWNIIAVTLASLVTCQAVSSRLYLLDQGFDQLPFMNLSADPCDDFYEYTCGNFKNLYSLKDGEVLIDQFTLLEDQLAGAVNEILQSEVNSDDPDAVKKAKYACQACVDESFMDTIGIKNPELEVIKKYGGFPIIGLVNNEIDIQQKPFGWYEIADMAAEFGIGIFLTPSLSYDTQNASRNILRITNDAMDIPVQFRTITSLSYDDAIEEGFIAMVNQSKISNRMADAQQRIYPMEILLRNFVLKLKRLLGSDRSDEVLFERVANVSNFMKGIYFGGYIPEGTEIGPITNDTYASVVTLGQLNTWTRKHFGDTIELDWVQYVQRLLQYTYVDVDENFLVLQPTGLNKILYGILNWVRMNDEEIVKSTALLRAFVYTASDGDTESRNYFDQYLRATNKTVYPRWKYCSRKIMDSTGTLSLGLAVTYAYQLEYFNNSKLENALALIKNFQATFKEVIEEATWMDDQSKAAAQTKANNIITLLGYPKFIKDPDSLDEFYENLPMTTWNHYWNAKNLRAFQQAYTLNMISKRQRTAWEKSPFDANAYYNRQNNRIIFPMAMLNPLFFQGAVSILDYSRIGMIIAHEITHGFDSNGYLYNPEGVIAPWWTKETISNFRLKTECFVDQYSRYTIPEINATMSGDGSLNENLADNGGLRTAFKALKKILPTISKQFALLSGKHEVSAEQLFYIGYGTMWCNTESITYLKALKKSCETTTTCHARSNMRVNGVVSNMNEFAEAFNCPVGSPMNPEKKCRLW